MTLLQVLRVALRALARSKMRSFLTVLGIVIGIIAVIVSVALGDGTRARVQAAFDSMGSNMLIVQSGTSRAGGAMGGFGSLPTLTWEDLAAIQTLPAVKYAAPWLRTNSSILSEDANWSTQVGGTSPDWFLIRDWRVAQGALFSQSDVEGSTKVVVLGRTVADRLFGAGAAPVGQQIRIRNVPFVVVGVLAAKGQSSFGQDLDDIAVMPYTTFSAKIQGGLKNLVQGQIVVGAAGREYTTPAEKQIGALLRDRHRLGEEADDDFQIRNLADAASAMDESMGAIAMLLKVFAAVSLVVGGIGIMNIMLVSVTERTREIGLRMAVGARGRDVLLQFLVEAVVLAALGGLVGVLAGVGIATLLARLLGWSLIFRPEVMVLAVAVSSLVGIVFGAYPARRASRLDPIQALRFE